jgi:hypothetical protein
MAVVNKIMANRPSILCFHGRVRYPDSYNDHLHIGFFEKAFRWHGYRVFFHGPTPGGEGKFDPKSDSLRRCIKKVKPRAVMIVEKKSASWAIAQASGLAPTFVYAVDIHSMNGSVACYAGADALMLRAKMFEDSVRTMRGGSRLGICRWFPFSVDMDRVDSVKPPPEGRGHDVVFCGDARKVYRVRRPLVDALRAHNLLSDRSIIARKRPQRAPFPEYIARLKSSVLGASSTMISMPDGKEFSLNMAKHVEIPACGTCLVTDGGPGMDELLPPDMYIRYDDVDDAVRKVKEALNDVDATIEIGNASRKHIRKFHSDRARAAQVVSFLEREVM